MTIELLYFDGCPNHERLRDHIPRLLAREAIEAKIVIHKVVNQVEADRERFLGSPTIRVAGRDIDPSAEHRHDYGIKCRIYQTPDGLAAIPPDEWILDALNGPHEE